MARAVLPSALPGKLFLLVWDRDRATFLLHVDDAEYSSYNLGSDIQAVRLQFKMWGVAEIGDRAIDVARELGAAKALLADGTVAAVLKRANERDQQVKFEEDDDGGAIALPALRANS